MSAWSHLPNAHHIDWVLKSVRENTKLWDAAEDASWNAALDAAWNAAGAAANAASWNRIRNVSLNVILNETSFISNSARSASRHVMAALIAYDDCDQFLNMTYEKMKVWAVLSEDPRALLLLPMIYVKEKLLQEVVV